MSADTNDLWAGTPFQAPAVNPFDPNGSPELHAAWEQQTAEERATNRAAADRARHDADVAAEVGRLRARRAAAAILAAEDAQTITVPEPTDLPDLLGEPDNPTTFRIEGLWPAGGTVVLAAAYKAGKTTTTGNLLRALADGDAFLGTWQVTPILDGRIGIIDLEMPRDRFKTWLRDQGIKHPERVTTWTLRGAAATFNILDPDIRDTWVRQLAERQVRVLVVDCLGPILSALGRDEDNQGVGPLLDALTTLAHQAGVSELLLVHHMGHGAERSRGASRLRDWPDAEWRIVRQRDPDNPGAEPAPNAPRFFAAFGRDVDIPEGQLGYDPHTRHLTYNQGNRREARARAAQHAVLEFVNSNPARSGRAIEAATTTDTTSGDLTRVAIREALAAAVATGLITTTTGPRRAVLHHLTPAGRTRLRVLDGEIDEWPPDPAPEPADTAPMVQCPACFAPHSGSAGTKCKRCEEAK